MKFKTSVFLIPLLLLGFNLPASPLPVKAWSATSVTISNTVDEVQSLIASANSGDPQGKTSADTLGGANFYYRGPGFVDFLQTKQDATAKVTLQFYVETNFCTVQPTNAAGLGTNYIAGGTTNFWTGASYQTNQFGTNAWSGGSISSNVVAAGAVCVLRHTSIDTYERNRIFAANGTNVTLYYPVTTQPLAGDIIYVYNPTAQMNVFSNSTTVGVNTLLASGAPGIVSAVVPGTPLLIDETNLSQINLGAINASGGYLP